MFSNVLLAAAGLALAAYAQTPSTVNISGPMTIVLDFSSGNATADISGSGSDSRFGSFTARASGSEPASECVTLATPATIGTTGIAPASFTLDYGGGNTMTGKLIMPCSAMVTALNGSSVPSSGSGTGSVTVTGGTGKFTGATGSFPTVTMNLTITGGHADGSVATFNCTAQLSGNGTIAIPGGGGGPTPVTSPVGASPAFGSASAQSMQFTFTDPRGAQDLDVVNVLINSSLDGRNACYLAYSRSAGVLYLVANDGGTLLGLPLNGSGSVSNGQCSIAGPGSSATPGGNNLVLTLNVSFTAAFAGNRIIYMAARDLQGNNSGWQPLGVWSIPGAGTFPSAVSASPARGTASAETLTVTYSDTKGAQDLGVVNVLINNSLDGRQACYLAYSQPFRQLYLVPDAGGGLSNGLTLGGAGSVSNSQCTINATGSSATVSGNTLTLTLNISFAAGFNSNRVIYLAARDTTEANNSGWQALATIAAQ